MHVWNAYCMMAESEPIDIIMCTWNSNKPWFRKCLLSIRREVDVHRFIVVDRYSSDDTISVIKSIFSNAIVIQTDVNLAVARQIGIRHVNTRCFAFIDDDVELCKDWLRKLLPFILGVEGIGAVQGYIRYSIDYLDSFAIFQLRYQIKGSIRAITKRGLTNHTIILTNLVKDFKPPSMVHSWEDFLMTQHIIKKGYRWIGVTQVQINHYQDAKSNISEGFLDVLLKHFERGKWSGSGARLVQAETLTSFTGSLIKTILFGLGTTVFILEPRAFLVSLVNALGLLIGFFSFKNHILPKRL